MDIPVHAIWLAQDDPKKNTAVRASKDDLLRLHKDFRRLPKKGIILEPLCGKVLGPEDREIFDTHGALADSIAPGLKLKILLNMSCAAHDCNLACCLCS